MLGQSVIPKQIEIMKSEYRFYKLPPLCMVNGNLNTLHCSLPSLRNYSGT